MIARSFAPLTWRGRQGSHVPMSCLSTRSGGSGGFGQLVLAVGLPEARFVSPHAGQAVPAER